MVLATGENVSAMIVRDGFLYWAPHSYEGIKRTSTCGGDLTFLTGPIPNAFTTSLTIAGGKLFFTTADLLAADTGLGSVQWIPLGGGLPFLVADRVGGPVGITSDTSALFWTSYYGAAIWRTPLSDLTAPTRIATGSVAVQAWGIAVGTSSVYWANANASPRVGGVFQAPLQPGGHARPFALTTDVAYLVLVDASSLFFCTSNGGGQVLWSAPLDGGSPVELALIESPSLCTFTLDDRYIYHPSATTLYRIAKTPEHTRTPVAEHVGAVWALAVDATHVYVANGDLQILRIDQP
jgi:hypothetical protein